MAYEKKLEELLSSLDAIDRPRARDLYTRLNQAYHQLRRKRLECEQNLKELKYKCGGLEKLNAEMYGSNYIEATSDSSHPEGLARREKLLSERDVYQSNVNRLSSDIKKLTEEVREIYIEFKPYLEQIKKTQLRKAIKPLALILICLSVASPTFFNYQSIGGYFILTRSNAYKTFFSLILFLVIGTIGFWYWKKK